MNQPCFSICTKKPNRFNINPVNQKENHKLILYTVRHASGKSTLATVVNSGPKRLLTDPEVALIPASCVITKVEFVGLNNFVTKGTFSIGLGQLNSEIMTILIENSDQTIATSRMGGCREFISTSTDGRNSQIFVPVPSCVNIQLEHPIATGHLQVLIHYKNI